MQAVSFVSLMTIFLVETLMLFMAYFVDIFMSSTLLASVNISIKTSKLTPCWQRKQYKINLQGTYDKCRGKIGKILGRDGRHGFISRVYLARECTK